MKTIVKNEYSATQKMAQLKAIKLEWLTLLYLCTVVVFMYLVMGASQAMKTAWIEDILSMVPPIMFLLSCHFINKPPTEHYPYGFHRVASIGFLVAALALLVVGGYLLIDAALKLFEQEHPTIGMKEFLGIDMWLGWWMILVLIWGTIPPVFLGRAKLKLAQKLNDKTLYTDAKMNKADWMTAVAAIGGVLGIGFGWWWADAAAALFISFDIVKDGYNQTKNAITGLINRAPTELNREYSDLPKAIIQTLESEAWINKAEVRIHEEGHLFFGEGFFQSTKKEVSISNIEAAIDKVTQLDWRIQGFSLTPMV